VYEGQYKDGKFNGKGQLTYNDRRTYQGEFLDGHCHGIGKSIYPDGSVYQGNWKDGERSGLGKLTLANGTKYVGIFEHDRLTGKGKAICVNGIYEGEFKNGFREGYGECKTFGADGNERMRYAGYWKNNKPNGSGKQTAGGTTLEGFFENGVFVNGTANHTTKDRADSDKTIIIEEIVKRADLVIHLKSSTVFTQKATKWILVGPYYQIKSTGILSYVTYGGKRMYGDFSSGLRCGLGFDIIDKEAKNVGLYKDGKLIERFE
jgi:hypothetical protein